MAKLTPMFEQYLEIKKSYRHCLLFFRLGDFYEMFFDDAIIATKELNITLTGREWGQEERAPMCGVPYHSAEGYIAKLVAKGYKVAICEQVEDPKQTKNIVKREVVRVVTQGTIIDTNMLDESKNNYIMCIFEDSKGFGVTIADVTTGEFLTTQIPFTDSKRIVDEVAKFSPAEIITNEGFSHDQILESVFGHKINKYTDWVFEYNTAFKRICDHFKVLNLNGYGLGEDEHSIKSSGALLEYLYETQKNSLTHISSIKKYVKDNFMNLDISSRKNLELTETIRDKSKKGSLLWVLDRTKTSMGARLLRKWIEQPLLDKAEIDKRLDSVEELKNNILLNEEFREILNTIYDIERIMSRIIYATANCRDLISLKNSIHHFPAMKLMLSNCKSSLLSNFYEELDTLRNIYSLINKAIIEEPPFSLREGGFIKDGYNEDLDKYRLAKNKGTTWLLDLESKEREETSIKNLKIRYNKIFGYYIEVTKSSLNLVPDRYIRRQTLSNCERYMTQELKTIEDDILGADEKIVKLEYEIFEKIRTSIADEVLRIQKSTQIIAIIDVISSLADVAERYNYIKPKINTTGKINIKEGRHPVVEQLTKNAFVPNDTYIDLKEDRLAIITGPNMAGKSTYMRQTALIVLLSQMGSFVPADSADISVTDRIFTRVGASDDLATGQSTFMIEMTEVANILNSATKNSLIILDEIGRGTSTFDGLSIAWSVLEHIANETKLGAKTLFATHYHELTELEGKVKGVKNYCITVEEIGEDIVFLRKIARGGAEYSFGIHVAKLAGIPQDVIERSNVILNALNKADIAKKSKDTVDSEVVYYTKKKNKLNPNDKIVINELLNLDIDALSPREALKALYDLQTKSKQFG